jgi:hypothetical protein
MWSMFWPALLIAAISSCGRSHEQLRRACNGYSTGTAPGEPCLSPVFKLEDVRRWDERQATKRLNGTAIERFSWEAPTPLGTTPFQLGIVEFDDQGNAWNTRQIHAVERALGDTLRRSHSLVVVFVHGWKNDCKACNGNLACFRESLALLAANEKRLAVLANGPPREVFGLYIAWRGASSTVEPAKEISFFSRKAAADRIGSSRGGELTGLLAWLNDARDTYTPASKSELGNMVAIVGHSFGADVLFGTVANPLDAAIGASSGAAELSAKPFGDLLLLVNPAFEASAYRRFADYAGRPWKAHQPSLMITVQARNDWATHYAFPVGRSISTLPQASGSSAGYREMLDALGHHSAYYTHDLGPPSRALQSVTELTKITGMKPAPAAPPDQLQQLLAMMGEKPSVEKCGCNGIRASQPNLDELFESIKFAIEHTPPPGSVQAGSPMVGLESQMQPCGTPNLGAPLLMVRTDASIVDGHSGITHLAFFDFLANAIVRTQLLRDQALHQRVVQRMAVAPAAAPASVWPACR